VPYVSDQDVESEGQLQMIAYLRTFKICLEPSEIADESIQQEVVVGPSEASIDQNARVDRRG